MNEISMYARPCVYKMTCAVQLNFTSALRWSPNHTPYNVIVFFLQGKSKMNWARVALGYRLEQLLRFFGALQTSHMQP